MLEEFFIRSTKDAKEPVLGSHVTGEYEEQRRERELRQLTRRAHKLGLTLTPAPTPTDLPAT
jgi:hypothetical protein